MCKLCRVVVVINGREAIHEALVTHSVDFADRPEYYSPPMVNKHVKGKGRIDCKISPACWCGISHKRQTGRYVN